MSQADELLEGLAASGIEWGGYTEERIVIDNDRIINVPDVLKRIAVQYDHDVETVTFVCPRYWDEYDLSQMKIYINYMRSDGVMGCYPVRGAGIDPYDQAVMHFDWKISRAISEVAGELKFLVCIKDTDHNGEEITHWNTELCTDMYVSEGLECDTELTEAQQDLITFLLTRMDYIETIATPESMYSYVTKFLTESDELKDAVYDYFEQFPPTTPEAMRGYVEDYMEQHPALIVAGPTKPGVPCLWFNTSVSPSGADTTTLKLTADNPNDLVYAEVEEDSTVVNDYTIL